MTDITNQAVGGTSGRISGGVISGVVDLPKAVTDGLTSGDTIKLFTLPAGTIFGNFDIAITEVLTGVTAIDVGYDDESDPDNLVNNNTDTAVGNFTTYEALCTADTKLTSDTPFYVRVTGTPTSGKLAFSIKVTEAAANAVEIARPHEYANS